MSNLAYLKQKLSSKRTRGKLRYDYYEMKNKMEEFSMTIPEEYAWLTETLGWCAKSVDVLADRMSFYQFKNDNFDFNTIYDMNNRDVLFDSAILEALITACSFIYIKKDENETYPKLQVINGLNATGILDPTTNMLKEGYAILERDVYDNPIVEAHFEVGKTTYYEKDKEPYTVKNVAPYPLLVPIIYRPDAKRPFGHSRISRACMGIMQGALRTLKRSEISAEFYSFPQKYILGMSPDVELDKWRATISSFLNISADENGDKPTVGQFQQQTMTPYFEQLRAFASLFAGETGLTLDDLGFPSDNPSSAEAIKASHENLRLYARKAQKTFGIGFLNAGYLAACLRDNYPYLRKAIYLTKPEWDPIFEPDMAMLSTAGDGVIKLNQAVPGYVGKDNLRLLTGIEASDE